MKRFIVALAAVGLLASPVFAGDVIKVGPGAQHHIQNIDQSNSNSNSNSNLNLNLNKNTNKNYNTNLNTNINTNVNTNAQAQGQDQKQYQGQYQGQGQGQSTDNANNSNQSVSFEASASTATGPSLTSGDDTCMGSTSIGGQGMSFGFSLGTTWIDRNCIRLKNANALNRMGHANAALALLAIDEDVAAALKATGVKYVSLEEVIEVRETEKLVEANPGATVVKGVYYGIDFEQID